MGGKIFVEPRLVGRTLAALRKRGRKIQASEIVVSQAFEANVLDAALHIPGARPNHPKNNGVEPLKLVEPLEDSVEPLDESETEPLGHDEFIKRSVAGGRRGHRPYFPTFSSAPSS